MAPYTRFLALALFASLTVMVMSACTISDTYVDTQADDSTKHHNGGSSWAPASDRITLSNPATGTVSDVNQAGYTGKWHAKSTGSLLAAATMKYLFDAQEDLSGCTSITLTGDSNNRYGDLLLLLNDGANSVNAYASSNTSTAATWDVSVYSTLTLTSIDYIFFSVKARATGIAMEFGFDTLSSA
jgi:hypothetical protein